MKTFFSILLFLLFIPNNQEPKPLYGGIFTETGYGVTDQNQPLNSGMTRSYYVKIYENKLVVTTQQYGSVSTIDIIYEFNGVDQNGYRIYTNGGLGSYYVDQQYDLRLVYANPSMYYGYNVMEYSY